MRAVRIFLRSIRDAVKSVLRNFSLSIASILCTTITLILVSVSLICAANIENATKSIEDELSIVVYLDIDIDEETIENIRTDIESRENVADVTFKSKTVWRDELIAQDDIFETVLNYLEENPLMDSFIILVNNVNELGETADYIKSISGVNVVKYGEGMVENIVSAFDIIEKIVIVIVIALIIVTAFLISNTIKLTIFSRRSAIEIMRLVGASNIAIKIPFIIEGFIIGIVGSIIPVCITIYGYVILYGALNGHIFSNMIVLIEPFNFVFWIALILVVLGAVVGMFGSLKAVRKYLKI